MPPDPELLAETRAWFAKALNGLRAAEALAATSPPLFDEAVFHCQQAAEKALKGFLAWHGCTFRKTHNLEEPGEQCLAIDPSLREVVDQAVPLSEYAWKFRYPGEPLQPDPRKWPRPWQLLEESSWLWSAACRLTCAPEPMATQCFVSSPGDCGQLFAAAAWPRAASVAALCGETPSRKPEPDPQPHG
jgi:HEPN domain-containing protein